MSADNSWGFDEPAERTALLGQRKHDPDLAAADATVVLALQGGFASQRLEDLLSRCQTDGEIDRELWDDLEIYRRSAHTYIDQYLDLLQQVYEERCSYIYEAKDLDNEAFATDRVMPKPNSNASAMTRTEWQLKISRDSLSRDLLAMHETLELLKMRTTTPSKGSGTINALIVCASMLALPHMLKHTRVIMWQYFHGLCMDRYTVGVLSVNTASLVAYHYNPPMRKWLRTTSIGHYQGEIEALLRRLNKNELDEGDRAGLSGRWCWMVEQFRQ